MPENIITDFPVTLYGNLEKYSETISKVDAASSTRAAIETELILPMNLLKNYLLLFPMLL